MTAIQLILIIVSVLFILMGVLILTRSISSSKSTGYNSLPDGVQQKDGLPILPRDQREFVELTSTELDDGTLLSEKSSTVEQFDTSQSVEPESDEVLASTQAFKDAANTITIDDAKTQTTIATTATSAAAGAIVSSTNDTFTEIESNIEVNDIEVNSYNKFDDVSAATTADNTAEDSSVVKKSPTDTATQNQPLHNAKETLSIHLLPNNEFSSIKGVDVLKQVEHYGFKFGEMNMFHRYQEKDGTGILWFSMMGLQPEGISPFDLHTIQNSEYQGLALFLSLPHPKVFQGFDSMMSIATLMARELDAQIVDDSGKVITPNYKKVMRAQLEQNYQ